MREDDLWCPGTHLSEQPGNKAGKGDTTSVTTWDEKLLDGLRNTVVTTWASPSNNQLLLGPRFLPGLEQHHA